MEHENTVFVIDDDGAVRESIVALAGRHGLRGEGYSSADAFLAQYDPARSGCIVVGMRRIEPLALSALESLVARPTPPVVVLADQADVPTAVRVMQAGASGFVVGKQEPTIWQEIERAIANDAQVRGRRRLRAEAEARLKALTEDEVEVFRRLLAGQANKRIASDLDIGLRTVELRRSNIMRKMQATSIPDLVRLAILIDFFKADEPPSAAPE